jgi:hypothetical protein
LAGRSSTVSVQSGGPAAASRANGESPAASSTQRGNDHATPARGSAVPVAALAEREHVESAVPGAQRVGAAFRPVHDAVAGPERAGNPFLPEPALSGQHKEDLLIGPMLVRGS